MKCTAKPLIRFLKVYFTVILCCRTYIKREKSDGTVLASQTKRRSLSGAFIDCVARIVETGMWWLAWCGGGLQMWCPRSLKFSGIFRLWITPRIFFAQLTLFRCIMLLLSCSLWNFFALAQLSLSFFVPWGANAKLHNSWPVQHILEIILRL